MNADKGTNPYTTEGAITIAKAEATTLRSVSTIGCTDKQQADINSLADDRQALVDRGQRLLDSRSGKIKTMSKNEEFASAEAMVVATEYYRKRFDNLVLRYIILASNPKN